MKVLCFSTLYPHAGLPSHGVFVENRLRRLVETGAVDAQVIAPVAWFPSANPAFGQYAHYATAPSYEERFGILIHHPRYVIVPKIGMSITPSLLARSAVRAAQRVYDSGFHFDMIDAHYFYPDGVAALAISRALGKPFMMTARGTDINLIPAHSYARKKIVEVAQGAAAVGAVCQALADEMAAIGIPKHRIEGLRNGVDLDLFQPQDRAQARKRWEVTGKTLVSVGGLIERKGHYLTIEALQSMPGVTLLLAGDGPDKAALSALAEKLGVADRVRLLGPVAHDDLPSLFTAADASVLASSREGWANVLLESLACGTPVAATSVWGTPEVVAVPEAGRLIPERSAGAIAQTVAALLNDLPDRAATRAYAEQFSWAETTQKQLKIFQQICAEAADGAPALAQS